MTNALDEEQFRRLAGYGAVEEVARGAVLYASGDDRYDCFLLRTAVVDVVRAATATAPERLVYRRGPGDFLGELSLLTGQRVYLTARVVEAGEVVRVPAPALRRALAEQVDVADVLLGAFQRRRELIRSVAGSALQVTGRADDAGALALRRFAAQMLLPHEWFEAGSAEGRTLLETVGAAEEDLPVAVVDEVVLRRASPGVVAEQLGLTHRPGDPDPDLLVVGAGPAGLAAAVYGASEGLRTLLLDGAGVGGQAAKSARIENYLGFPDGISGTELTRRGMVQALKFGVRVNAPCEVVDLDLSEEGAPTVVLADGSRIRAGALIAASGARYRHPDLPRWADFERRGCIRYSATDLEVEDPGTKPVVVLGGANSAGQAALTLAGRGTPVHLVVHAADLTAKMSTYLVERVRAHPLIEVHLASTVTDLDGEGTLTSITVGGTPPSGARIDCASVFCFIGAEPASGWLRGVDKDEHGFVVTDAGPVPFETSARSVFAVGDLRAGSIKRVATATGEGASAVASVHTALRRRRG